jgi:hypothetical protein
MNQQDKWTGVEFIECRTTDRKGCDVRIDLPPERRFKFQDTISAVFRLIDEEQLVKYGSL